MVKPCVFLDRDGVINIPEFRDGRSYAPKQLIDFNYFPDTKAALVKLKTAGFLTVIITNQPDVGNNLTPRTVVEAMHQKMRDELPIDHIEVCYHSQKDQCDCRKPKPGMLLNADKKFNIDFKKSYLIGDRSSDIEAGKKLHLKTILIDHHYTEPLSSQPDYRCDNLLQGVNIIL